MADSHDARTAGVELGNARVGQKARTWATADRISDRIVDLLNEELATMRSAGANDPIELFAGQLLGLLATMSTAPPFAQPATFREVERAARACLQSLNLPKPSPR